MKRGDLVASWVPAQPAVAFAHATQCGSVQRIRQVQNIAGTSTEGTSLITRKQGNIQHSPFNFILRHSGSANCEATVGAMVARYIYLCDGFVQTVSFYSRGESPSAFPL